LRNNTAEKQFWRILPSLVCAAIAPREPTFTSIDPETRQPVFLFNPRRDERLEHFRLDGPRIIPLTPVGRATARLLKFSEAEREQARRVLWLADKYPG